MNATDIEAAADRIHGHVRHTPILELEPDALGCGAQLVLKLEFMQHTGAFKARGAFNRILCAPVPDSGVIAASGGNHGAAVAYAARQLGRRAEIFVPESTPDVKVDRLRRYGARVVLTGASYGEAWAASQARARESGALEVHAYDQPEVVAGQGTLAREFEQQCQGLDTVFVAVGGGGLIGGVAAWFAGRVKVIAVEPERCPTLYCAIRDGEPVDVEVGGIAADSLGARRIGRIAFEVAQQHVDSVVLVSDQEIRDSQRALWDSVRVLVEPGAAAALAGLRSGKYQLSAGERIGVVVCGANTDPTKFVA
ncbi:MAG: threonine/serine dehydratase [Burkholderiales bacterium]|nr:threonine/serine dehydratase [Burkholderiales bacterium]